MPPQILTRSELLAKLNEILREFVIDGVPGLSAAICCSRGVLWDGSAGLSDVKAAKPIETSHLFGIGSITKVFVAIVILQLVEEGKLGLLDTAGRILDASVLSGIENACEATVTRLLGHEAGIDSWEDEPSWIVHGRGKETDPERVWRKLEPLDYIRRPRAIAPDPGQWYYSNTNFTLLGLMIEAITQSTAEGEIRRRILEPLGMSHTFLEGFEQPCADIAGRYHWNTKAFRESAGICPSFPLVRSNLIDVTCSNLSTEWAAGCMVSSVTDLLRLAMALRHGKLLGPESMAFMLDWRPTPSLGENGHGIFRLPATAGGDRWLGHFGGVLGFTAALWWQEEGDCAVCVLSNVGTMHSGATPPGVGQLILKSEFLDIASRLATL